MGIRDFDTVLTDPENKVATSHGVMQWAVGSEPGHTFVLVDESGEVAWLQDYVRWRTAASCMSSA
jgi:hypothetical protein